MALLRLDKVSLAFGDRDLLTDAEIEIDAGEKVCVVGRNGEGKSSLLRLINGDIEPDSGTVWRRPGIRIACLAQEVERGFDGSVFDVVAGGLSALGRMIGDYHRALTRLAANPGGQAQGDVARLQHELESNDGWRLNQRVEKVLSRLSLTGDRSFGTLSGGQQRRVMLARALIVEPDLLLLDEPTNHLDIEAIAWIEDYLDSFSGAVLFVSHDRAFVRGIANRICDLDRGILTSWSADYDTYRARKAAHLEAEARENARSDKRLAEEEAWIRQGIKARRTRNEGRVRALQALREQRRRRRERRGTARLSVEGTEESGRLVFETANASLGFDDKRVIDNLSVRIRRGDRVGIIGPNGAGKSTLIRLLLGELQPDSGSVRRGTRLEIAYFDQQRQQLDPDRSVMDSVADGNQRVRVGGRDRHVAGYLRDFLFPPQRLQSPVSSLSGGERNRLLLARLFTRPANLLILDEPTNDLDIETLELLEELVSEFDGTVLLVSHDRAFLDNVVTSTLVFEGGGRIAEFVGGYSDWLRQRPAPESADASRRPTRRSGTSGKPGADRPRKLGFNEKRELAALPAQIEALESEQQRLQQETSNADFYQQDKAAITAALARLAEVGSLLEQCYARWEELESTESAASGE